MTREHRRRSYTYQCKFSLSNKIARTLWGIVWAIFFRPTPRNLHAWRRFLLKMFGAKLDKKTNIYPSVRIWAPWNLVMHEGSGIGEYVDVYSVDTIELRRGAAVSQYTFLCTASHDYHSLKLPLVTAPIVVGENAWVTADVFVAPGVEIGKGAVVLARSSVFNDIEDWSIVGGNPATFIRKRTLRDEYV